MIGGMIYEILAGVQSENEKRTFPEIISDDTVMQMVVEGQRPNVAQTIVEKNQELFYLMMRCWNAECKKDPVHKKFQKH